MVTLICAHRGKVEVWMVVLPPTVTMIYFADVAENALRGSYHRMFCRLYAGLGRPSSLAPVEKVDQALEMAPEPAWRETRTSRGGYILP